MIEDKKSCVVPFLPIHFKGLELHEFIGHAQKDIQMEIYGQALSDFPSYSYLVDGKVICCAGVMPFNSATYHAWAFLVKDSGRHMVGVTRQVIKFLDSFDVPRIQTNVRCDFVAGHKWMNMLGFTCETPVPMKKFGEDGYDYYLYARVR